MSRKTSVRVSAGVLAAIALLSGCAAGTTNIAGTATMTPYAFGTPTEMPTDPSLLSVIAGIAITSKGTYLRLTKGEFSRAAEGVNIKMRSVRRAAIEEFGPRVRARAEALAGDVPMCMAFAGQFDGTIYDSSTTGTAVFFIADGNRNGEADVAILLTWAEGVDPSMDPSAINYVYVGQAASGDFHFGGRPVPCALS